MREIIYTNFRYDYGEGGRRRRNENFYGFIGLPNFVSVQSFRRWRYLERCRAERLVHWSFPFSLFAPHQHFPLTWNPRATTHFKLATFHFCLAFLFSCPRNSSQFLRARLAPELKHDTDYDGYRLFRSRWSHLLLTSIFGGVCMVLRCLLIASLCGRNY